MKQNYPVWEAAERKFKLALFTRLAIRVFNVLKPNDIYIYIYIYVVPQR